MALSLNTKFVEKFVSNSDIDNISEEIYAAQKQLINRDGEGNSFLGWIDLPVDYDKE